MMKNNNEFEKYIDEIQIRIVKQLKTFSDDLSIASKDQCSEVARLIGCWILEKFPDCKAQIYKGELSDKTLHDILVINDENKFYLIDPTIWQIFPKSDSIFIGTVHNKSEAIDLLQKKYGGIWKISENMQKCDENHKKKLLNTIIMKRGELKIILGSRSKGRQQILRENGFDFQVVTADFDEKLIRNVNPKKLVLALANAKADAILPKIKESAILITADQVVVYDGKIREKPENIKEARDFLRSYSTHPIETISAVVVTNTLTGKKAEGVDIVKTYFRPIPEKVIDEAINIGWVLIYAGAMRSEDEPLKSYVLKKIGTDDSTSGMPLKLLKKLIKKIL